MSSQIISINVENKTATIRRYTCENTWLEMMYSMTYDELKNAISLMKEKHGGDDNEWLVRFDKNDEGGVDISFERNWEEVVPLTKEILQRFINTVPDFSRHISDMEKTIVRKEEIISNMDKKILATKVELESLKAMNMDSTHAIVVQVYHSIQTEKKKLETELGSLRGNLIMYKDKQKSRDELTKLLEEVE